MIRNQYPVRRRYPMRSRFAIVTAIVLALCVGVSSAIAQPMDQTPPVKPAATANVYVPPAELWASPATSQVPASSQPLPSANGNTAGDHSPWLVIALAVGGFVVVSGCAAGFQHTRRKRPVA